MSAESRLKGLRIELPPVTPPKGLYRPLVIVGNLAYTSGHLPAAADGTLITGRLGADLDEQAGARPPARAGLAILATVRGALGSLDCVRRVVRIFGVVQCTPEFTRQPAVLNGCSQLFAEVFGAEEGVGARSAIGVGSLPLGAAVEIEATFEID